MNNFLNNLNYDVIHKFGQWLKLIKFPSFTDMDSWFIKRKDILEWHQDIIYAYMMQTSISMSSCRRHFPQCNSSSSSLSKCPIRMASHAIGKGLEVILQAVTSY